MKRTRIAVLITLVAVMLFTLAGCGGDEAKFVGKWSTSIDMLPVFEAGMKEGAAEDPESAEILDYFEFSSFELTYTYTFNEDGTFKGAVDEDALAKQLDNLRAEARKGFEKMLQEQIDANNLDMTVEELAKEADIDIDATVNEMFTEEMVDELTGDMNIEGNFEAREGKLYCSAGLEYAVDEAVYETYEITDTELKLIEYVGDEDEVSALEELEEYGVEIYPMTFTRVK